MKNFMKLCAVVLLVSCVSCSEDDFSNSQEEFNLLTTPDDLLFDEELLIPEVCFETTLIAGQHHDAGTVSVTILGDELHITYTSNDSWIIEATHLHVTNCEDGGFPTTGSGNPKIGLFDYSTSHDQGTQEVTHIVPLADLQIEDAYCIAAHAEVTGPSGNETAWAQGEEFEGNSWAMYTSSTLSSCGTNSDDDDDNEGGGGVLF